MKEKIAYSLICSLCVSAFAAASALGQLPSENVAKEYILQDDKPANTTIKAWENDSYPLGNGYFGVSFFGGIQKELWQFTEPSVVYSYQKNKKSHRVELTSAIELWLETDHNSMQVSVKSLNGNACTLQYCDRFIKLVTEPGKTYCFDRTMKMILAK